MSSASLVYLAFRVVVAGSHVLEIFLVKETHTGTVEALFLLFTDLGSPFAF